MAMRTITKEELTTILENHKHWLNEDVDGWENMRADLSYTYLNAVDLSNVDLRYADLQGSILTSANLKGTCLNYTNLTNANLTGADLKGVNLKLTDLTNAKLTGAIFNKDDIANDYPMVCPDTGSFIGWKKCLTKTRVEDNFGRTVIVKLLIPEDARRSSATGRKCRCDKAVVLDIEGADVAYSDYDHDFVYRKGETVSVDNFDDNRFNECAPGIHFFITREEAVRY